MATFLHSGVAAGNLVALTLSNLALTRIQDIGGSNLQVV